MSPEQRAKRGILLAGYLGKIYPWWTVLAREFAITEAILEFLWKLVLGSSNEDDLWCGEGLVMGDVTDRV